MRVVNGRRDVVITPTPDRTHERLERIALALKPMPEGESWASLNDRGKPAHIPRIYPARTVTCIVCSQPFEAHHTARTICGARCRKRRSRALKRQGVAA